MPHAKFLHATAAQQFLETALPPGKRSGGSAMSEICRKL